MSYKVLPTKIGLAKFANYIVTKQPIEFKYLAVGDGGGVPPQLNQNQTALVNETARVQINSVTEDPLNEGQFTIEGILPENVGGFWVREAGIFDTDGDLLFIADYPPSEKPVMASGSGRVLRIRLVIAVSESASVVLKIDPSVVLATRDFVDAAILALKKDISGVGVLNLMPVDSMLLWSSSILPVGGKWMVAGTVFDTSVYPELAAFYPNGIAGGDASDRFLRIMGNSTILTNWQHQEDAIRNITGSFGEALTVNAASSGAIVLDQVVGGGVPIASANQRVKVYFDASRQVPTASENRPKTIVVRHLIIKAKS